MNNYSYAVDFIKNSVSAIDIGNALGLNVDQHGRCSCPFHNGKDRNMKLFPGNRGYSCFVCHASGDVISFVRRYYDLSFKDAVAWINDNFHMGLDLESTITPEQRREAEKAQRMRKEAMEFSEWKERTKFGLALAADQILEKLEESRDMHAPKTKDERWDDAFCTAVRLIPAARKFAEKCMAECIEKK